MKTSNETILELGKQDFEDSWKNDSRMMHESVGGYAIKYIEDFEMGDKEGYEIRVIDNVLTFTLLLDADVVIRYKDGRTHTEKIDIHELKIPVGYKTPKGYFSKKKVDVDFDYQNGESLTLDQSFELMKFQTDAKKNTFDPFWHKNESNRKNASAINYIARNFITDPWCTR